MATKSCERCGQTMPLARADARYCGGACRVAAHRAAKSARFPARMTGRSRWMRYRLAVRGGKTTKVPTTVAGRNASSTNPATWTDFDTARHSDVGAGLGFALGDGVGCIDLDHCIDEHGKVADWARNIIAAAGATFMEVSQSGHGIHIFGLLPERAGRNLRSQGATVEVYSTGRFIAVTGRRFERAPLELADITELVAALT